MVRLRADEHRYLVTADGAEEALLKTVPGCRFVTAAHAHQLPRQPGSVIALDRLFGEQGWECPTDLVQEVLEARGRQSAAAQHEAHVSLVGNELSVECAFGDKELVKLVPGYRWSAPQRRWFLPASPMALAMLREQFGPLLAVAEDAEEFLELKQVDEAAAVERAREVGTREPVRAEPVVEPVAQAENAEIAETESAPAGVNERLDRLATAVEELVALLREGVVHGSLIATPMPVAEPTAGLADEVVAGIGWRELLAGIDEDAAEVREQAVRLAQTATPEQEPAYRAVAGLAMARLGENADALTALRRALERQGAIEEDLSREATDAYATAVLALLREECGPEGALNSGSDFRDLLLEELVSDSGFEDERLGSSAAQSRLDYLVNDPVLRRINPALSDYARMAHLLGVARGGQWMAATRITDILREQALAAEGFALALILLANALYSKKSVNDWDKAWPRTDVAETLQELSWLVAEAERRLRSPSVGPAMAEAAALSCLACIAGGPVEWASNAQRKVLAQFIPLRNSARREYADFLAAFQPAAAGQKDVLGVFPGWTKVLAQMRLSRSAPYLMDVAANDNGGSNSLTWAMAEDVYIQALTLWGVDDAQTEMIDLLDLLEGGKRPDNYLNQAGRLVEDPDRLWTGQVSREQRKRLFRRALEASLKQGHDKDSLEAFDRLIRELRQEGAAGEEEITATCVRLSTGMRAVRGPALEVLLGMQLETGLPFEQTAEQLVNQRGDYEGAAFALAGVFHLFPEFRSWWEAKKPAGVELERDSGSMVGKKVLVVGGHKWLEQRVKPVLEDEWRINLTWQDADEAIRSDLAKARNADLVIVNAACIGHSASGRIGDAARSAGVPIVVHHLRGAGSMLARMAHELSLIPRSA